jgi:hypothetical protein
MLLTLCRVQEKVAHLVGPVQQACWEYTVGM